MNQIACPVFAYFNKSILKPNRQMYLSTNLEYVVLDQFYYPNLGIFVDVENQLFALENSDSKIIRSYY
jgi:hypothetical protein